MDNSQLSSVIIGKLMNIGGILQREGNRMLLPYNLNQQQFSVFFEITKAGRVKQKDMVNRLMLEKAHVSKVVKKLQKMGLITVTTSDEDKRSSWLSATPKGEETMKSCSETFEKWNREWMSSFNEKQLNSIVENLSQIQTVFTDNIQKDQ